MSGVSVMHDDAAQNIICNQCWIHNHTQNTCATKDEPTHTPRRCHLWCLLPAPRSVSLSVSRPLLWRRLCSLSPLSSSLSDSPQPVCVCVCVCVCEERQASRNIHVQPRTNPHTHLAAVTCVVSCRRLAASLSRLASRCCGVGCVRCRLSASFSRLAARCCGVGCVRCRLSAPLSRLAARCVVSAVSCRRLSASLSRLAARCWGVGCVRCRLSASLSRLARSLCVWVRVCV